MSPNLKCGYIISFDHLKKKIKWWRSKSCEKSIFVFVENDKNAFDN